MKITNVSNLRLNITIGSISIVFSKNLTYFRTETSYDSQIAI